MERNGPRLDEDGEAIAQDGEWGGHAEEPGEEEHDQRHD